MVRLWTRNPVFSIGYWECTCNDSLLILHACSIWLADCDVPPAAQLPPPALPGIVLPRTPSRPIRLDAVTGTGAVDTCFSVHCSPKALLPL